MVVRLKSKSLRQIRRELADLQPGQSWCADHPITVDEFNRITPDGTYAELFEGVIYVPAPNIQHEVVYAFLFTLLKAFVGAMGLGIVLGSRSGVRLDDYSAPQPDILFVRKERRSIIHDLEIVEPPDLLMEIVWSDSSRYRAMAKMTRYEQFEVPELWYIDLPNQALRVTYRNGDGEYQTIFEGTKGIVRSKAVAGFAIRAEWLWRDEANFPDIVSTVQELIAGRVPR